MGKENSKILILSLILFMFFIGVVSAATLTVDSQNINEREIVIAVADRLIDLQNTNGSWDWVVTDATGPTTHTYRNLAGTNAEVLLDAYKLTGDSEYLDAAENTGDYILSFAISSSNRYNAFNINFLYHLYDTTGDSDYKDHADALMYHTLFEENYWSSHNGDFCGTTEGDNVNGCTASELAGAIINFRSAYPGYPPWDLYNFVEAGQTYGNTTFANEMATETQDYWDTSSLTSSDIDYILGLTGVIFALEKASMDSSSYVTDLLAEQDSDGHFETIDPDFGLSIPQVTAYALMALKQVEEDDAAQNAADYLMDEFSYDSIDGWLESDGDEYSEVTSEAGQALFDYIYVPNNYYTIQDAIDAASDGDTIEVVAGDYDEDLVIDKEINLIGPNEDVNPNTETREDEATITGQITINSDNVIINGFTITNGQTSGMGIYSADHSNLEITNNIITDIGNSLDDVVGRGIVIVSSSSAVDNIEISNNQIKDITSGLRTGSSSTSSSGISIGWSTGTEDITNLLIQNNEIFNINADTSPWTSSTKGQGANGILINHGSHGGQTVAPQILDNKIYDLEGLWVHAIGLEGDTPNAVVEGNEISDLTDHKDPSDAADLFFEDNPSADTVTINNNILLATVGWGLAIHPDLIAAYPDLIVTAINNWWGTNDEEEIADMIFGNVDYTPWITQSEDEVETEAETPYEIDTTGTDTSITLTTSSAQSGTVSVQQSSSDSHGGFSASALGKFISIESDIPDSEISNAEIGIHYDNTDVLAAGIDESTLKIYWWNGVSWEFEGLTEGCHDSVGCYGVDTTENYVWIVTDHFSDYGAGGDPDTEGPSILDILINPTYPNLASTLITVYATITDPSGVVDYPELRWRVIKEGVTYPETGYYSAPQMSPVGDDIYRTTFEIADPEDNMSIEYKIVAEDELGNDEESSFTFEELFTYDGSAPTTLDDASVVWTNSDVTVTLTCDDPISGCAEIYYKINDGEFTEYTVPFTLTDTGEYQLYYYSVDNAGNEEEVVTGTLVRIDKEIPTSEDDYINDGVWINEDQTISLSEVDNDGLSDVTIKYCTDTDNTCDPLTGTDYSSAITISDEGTNYLRYQAVDEAGNEESVHYKSVMIDKTTPVTTDDVPADWQTFEFDIILTETISDGFSPVTTYYKVWEVGEDEPENWTEGTTIPITEDGEYNIKYYSEDEAGNIETEVIALNTAKLDTTQPSLTLDSDAETYADDFNLEITESDDTSGLGVCEYQINSGGWTARTCEEDLAITVGDSGGEMCDTEGEDACTVEVRTIDVAGNERTESKTFNIDWTNPPSILSSGPSGTIINSATILYVATNKPAVCRYDTEYKSDYDAMSAENEMVNSGDLMYSKTLTELTDKSYTYYVICKDAVNNEMSYPATISFDVDTREGFAVTIPETKGDYLREGWNNFYLPSFVLENTSLEYNETLGGYGIDDVLESIEGKWEAIYHFDGTGWLQSYRPERPVNDLTHFNGGEFPYFIYMNVSGERIEIEY